MTATPSKHTPGPQPGRCKIRVKGLLDQRWAEWFDGLTLTGHSDGTTLLEGQIADQAALHGVLYKVRDLALPIISVQWIDTKDED